MFFGRRWLLQHHHRRLGLWDECDGSILSLTVKSIGVGMGLKLSRVFPVVWMRSRDCSR
ncbi:unnamed protein product [Brassica rapa subsp. narinosa]